MTHDLAMWWLWFAWSCWFTFGVLRVVLREQRVGVVIPLVLMWCAYLVFSSEAMR